ncbi:hypothetical protein FVR03_01465 [Pontibacter qinzhouensis]|uniref:Glycosyltransferase RgtA/B/C/D-like domain-containing protein n=1 Tax=Pontibacter qinzhouensis TaxID=2603253 RepID=A0A5C8KFR7_9BACT|nr:hypothetical protein [Pontibacter qinzhouensis]TXK52413.1 hypothetical protein FVR03_01465 [Pontibacter qinzhouensis]
MFFLPSHNRLLLLLFLVLYVVFPTSNSSLDAYFYAGAVKYGEHLFLPHHLLYNSTCYLLTLPLRLLGAGVDVLSLLKVLNALFAVLCLWVLTKILQQLQVPAAAIFSWLLVAGASFGVWRFATENEVYLLPLIFSLGASYLYVRYSRQPKKAFLVVSGILAALACLYHQVQFFWWLGLLAGVLWQCRSIGAFVAFALPALLVPVGYVLVVVFYLQQPVHLQHLLTFVFHDFTTGSAGTSVGLLNFTLTGISLVRTFVQVHGLMWHLVSQSWFWILPAMVSGTLVVFALLKVPLFSTATTTASVHSTGKIHLLILLLHLGFAWFAVGNAEFMVMVPYLLPLVLWNRVNAVVIRYAGLAMLVWNFCYGIFPAYYFNLSTSKELAQRVKQQPEALFVLQEANAVRNLYYYIYGLEDVPTVLKSPAQLAANPAALAALANQLHSHLQTNPEVPILTDCVQKQTILNRAFFVTEDFNEQFFQQFGTATADSLATFYGKHYLHILKTKAGQATANHLK